MNKKLMAAAVAGVLVAPAAYAQSSNVQLYGRANLGVDYYQAKGATTNAAGVQNNLDGRFRVFDNSSRVGLRGTEELGGGLKAIFQIETGVAIDTGNNTGQAGTVNGSAGFWASRDSYVGLQGGWGRVTFGRQSIFWANGVNAQFAANYINTEIPWTNGTNSGRLGFPTARTPNTVQYTTPTFGGFNLTASWSPTPQEAVQGSAPPPLGSSVDTDGSIWGLTGRFTAGPFYGQVDWATVNTGSIINNGTSIEGKRSALKVGVSWGYMPGARIGLVGTWKKGNLITGASNGGAAANPITGAASNAVNDTGSKGKQWMWALGWEHTFGNFQAMAQYGMIGDLRDCNFQNPASVSCDDTGGWGGMIGGRYFLSKRTWLYASWNRVNNDANQFADYTGGNITSAATNTYYGADPQIFAFGIFHHF